MAVLVQFIWQTGGEVVLSSSARERLDSYITRYAQTMGIAVYGVGGTDTHLHVLFQLPVDKTLKMIETELRKTTTRFLRESLSLSGFNWAEDAYFAGIAPDEGEAMVAYLKENPARHLAGDTVSAWELPEAEVIAEESVPDWIRGIDRSG